MDQVPDFAAPFEDVIEAEDRTVQAFASTLEFALGEVTVRWTDPLPPAAGPGGRPVTHMPVFDVCYPVNRTGAHPDPRWGGAHFEWSFGISELRDDRPGEVAFAAGVAIPAAGAALLDAPDWLARRRAGGFGRLHNPRLGTEQLLRWLDVDTVLAAGEPVAQGDLVADWVVTTFEELAADPPSRAG